ncbi:hypothetical protein B0H13DRAFT_1887263 [Mycena leptocephala]|nr:hypothetical protein B0H13DRAFT_1887263 [Mycena leptocephala]
MALPIVDRYEANPSAFIVNTTLGVHYFPTRDNSILHASLFTFKHPHLEHDPTGIKRGRPRVYTALVFGTVDNVSQPDEYSDILVRLTQPINVSCRASALYRDQVLALSAIISDDVRDTICLPPSWSSDSHHLLRYGVNVEFEIALKRIDVPDRRSGADEHIYTAIGGDFRMLSDVELPQRADDYRCDNVGDRTLAGGSLYTFKSVGTPVEEEIGPTNTRRGSLRRFKTLAFGGVDTVCGMENQGGVCLRICPPVGASCEVLAIYARQLSLLQTILNNDARELVTRWLIRTQGGVVRGSWFSSRSLVKSQEDKENCFYVYLVTPSISDYKDLMKAVKPGHIIDTSVSLQRIDLRPEGEHSSEREYSLLGHHLAKAINVIEGLSAARFARNPHFEQAMPLYPLSHFPTLAQSGEYGTDFVSVRHGSTRDGIGSVYVYRSLSGLSHMLAPRNVRPNIVTKSFYLSGFTLGMPPFPNETAVELQGVQHKFLTRIAEVDVSSAGCTCVVVWGPEDAQHDTPTVSVSILRPKDAYEFDRWTVGDDLIVWASIYRTETVVGDALHIIRGATAEVPVEMCLIVPLPTPTSPQSRGILPRYTHMSHLFDLFASPSNPATLANGRLYMRFLPTRDRSTADGSVYSYKDCRTELEPTETSRGALVKYYPMFFGEIVRMSRMCGGFVFQLACPGTASTVERSSYAQQLQALTEIVVTESIEKVTPE